MLIFSFCAMPRVLWKTPKSVRRLYGIPAELRTAGRGGAVLLCDCVLSKISQQQQPWVSGQVAIVMIMFGHSEGHT